MRTIHARRAGFTLIELMITVAIIGILAALAIPNFIAYQNRSKRSEAMMNLEAIVKSEIAYFATNGVFKGTIPVPAAGMGPKVPWDAAAQGQFDELGYAPEGAVWYRYEVNAAPSDCAGCGVGNNGEAVCFTASAYGDIDGDLFVSVVSYFYPDPAGATCVTGIGTNGPPPNPATGNPMLNTPVVIPVGPGSDDF